MKLKNWLYILTVALLVGATVVACSSSNDEVKKEEEPGGNPGDDDAKVTLSLGITVYGDISTRSGRPLCSSEALQAVSDVVVYYFRQEEGGSYVYAGTHTIENFSEATSASAKKTVKIDENLPDGMYRFLMLGLEKGYEGTYAFPDLQEGKSTLEEMALTLQEGAAADEFFVGVTPGITVATGKTVYVNMTLKRAVAAVFGYFKNIPVQVNGKAVKSLAVKTVRRAGGVSLGEAIAPSGTPGDGENLLLLDLSATPNDGTIYTCDAVTSGSPAKEANSWIVGGYSLPLEGVQGEATLQVNLCSDAKGEVVVKSWEVKCLDGNTTLALDAIKDFSLNANLFYGMGIKTTDGSVLETDAAVDLSTAAQIIINKKIYQLDVLAFPTAVGFGAEVTGARGVENMEVYRVTNLNASGEGSFADAISKGGRFVVFDVAGVIDMGGRQLVLKSNQTILFQTAPGDGIELYNTYVSASGASNLIVRYMRVRTGRQISGSDNHDACGVANGKDIIFDHCSFTWGVDEVFSINPDNKGTRPKNITLQNSIIGQGCMNHSAGGLIQTGEDEGVTIFRNLLIDNKTRNFKVKGLNQYVNNVIYNWGNGAAYNMGGESEANSTTTIENNYFIKGPCWTWTNTGVEKVDPAIIGTDKCVPAGSDGKYYEVLSQQSPARPFTGGNADFKTYCVGNYYDHDRDGALNGIEITQGNWTQYCSGSPTFLGSRPEQFTDIRLKTTAAEAYEWIVKNVGATLPARDKVDAFMIEELTSLGLKGTIFRNQRQELEYPLANTWQNINTASDKPQDSDGDGIPDYFEEAHGLNKNDPSDAVQIARNGYTHLENYVFIEIEGEAVEY